MQHLRILPHQALTTLISYILLNVVAFGAEPPTPIDFKKRVLPLLTERCGKCHSEDVRIVGLTLTTAAGIKKGSQNGPVVIPEEANDSLLYKRLKLEQMPPGGEGKVFDADRKSVV